METPDNKFQRTIFCLVALIAFCVGYVIHDAVLRQNLPSDVRAGASQINYVNSASSSRYVITSTSVLVFPTSTNSQWVRVSVSGNGAWLNWNGKPAIVGQGEFVPASSTPFVIDPDHLFIGSISAISDTGQTVINVNSFTKTTY